MIQENNLLLSTKKAPKQGGKYLSHIQTIKSEANRGLSSDSRWIAKENKNAKL